MENKKVELPLAANALSELSATVAAIATGLKNKQDELNNNLAKNEKKLAQKEQCLAELQIKTTEALQNIDGLISQIDNILENDGTSNNNN